MDGRLLTQKGEWSSRLSRNLNASKAESSRLSLGAGLFKEDKLLLVGLVRNLLDISYNGKSCDKFIKI